MYGSALVIQLANALQTGEATILQISYATTDKCSACQWLTPSQTVGKVHGYMFTQCQAIRKYTSFSTYKLYTNMNN